MLKFLRRWFFDYSVVDEIVETTVREFSPEKIIIFGSVARHEAGPNSDVDMLVVMDYDEGCRCPAAPLYYQLRKVHVPKDIIVVTPERYDSEKDDEYTFIYEAASTGTLAYEKQNRRLQALCGFGL